ncbi:transglycosylase domain-containing protein [Propionivibrio soli]|uniref:transglycosylase domain-containing protein n=1 Tax=Propionivibrio soli TaxID=2976531 RepID=UPI0021E74D7E|nr:transglycosylase domain-containing protein [Propionivibrio soli]
MADSVGRVAVNGQDEKTGRGGVPKKLWKRRIIIWGGLALMGGAAATAGLWEARDSRLQARYFSEFARTIRWSVEPGPNASLWLPQDGPYDVRLGYVHMKDMLPRLDQAGYAVVSQARQSDGFRESVERGFYPIYREKSQAGLRLLDRHGKPLYASRYPQRQYRSFDEIPPVLVDALLYIENRGLLDPEHPMRNPAVDWGRFTRAAFGHTLRAFDLEGERGGGSTLATQIEKFRHSPGGRTRNTDDKLRQMISASLRAYSDGEETLVARQRIVLDYLNSVPLAGLAGYGEVNGIGDGLWAWYGRDFAEANRVLADPSADPALRAQVFREMLSLIVAQRRPSGLLLESTERLDRLTDSYLRLLASDGGVPEGLRDAALKTRLDPARRMRTGDAISFVERKAINDARGTLGDLLGVEDLYALDRFDLEARTTLDTAAQAGVTAYFSRLAQEDYLRCAGFKEKRLLDRGDPTGVNYSFTLYERTALGNVLRVQADNLNQPLDINAGTKLDLGSSAKFRTLISYLSVVADLHRRYADVESAALARVETRSSDKLTNWALGYLREHKDRDLTAMLEAAMERRYSANPNETFFTGGGVHRFSNFKHEDDGQMPSVAGALEQSINLVFVRIMDDVVHYHAYEAEDAPARSLREGDDKARQDFLNRFAEREGIGFLRTFWHKYRDVPPDERLEVLADSVPAKQAPLAAAYLAVVPEADFATFEAFMREHLGDKAGTEGGLRRIHELHATRNFNLSDQGYLARVHPLELWLVRYLRAHPDADLRTVVAESVNERREASRWLFSSRFRHAQQVRIDIVVEVAAFERIAAEWRRLGYPFEHLVPSLATSIGSSADRPAALAELMGIVVNDGVRRPTVRIDRLHFAAATPYETLVERRTEAGEQVLPPEIARVARRALLRVVDSGTARRVKDIYLDADDHALTVGGKTGTGDHRFDVVAADGTVKSSRVMNRAATFAFYIGDRFFGVVTAFVPGGKAAGYDFTSALPVQILKELQPVLRPLIAGKDGVPGRCAEAGKSDPRWVEVADRAAKTNLSDVPTSAKN